MCSIETKPSRSASARSRVVTSFCQSTNALPPAAPALRLRQGAGVARHRAIGRRPRGCPVRRESGACRQRIACCRRAAGAAPSSIAAASENTPRQEPAERTRSAACRDEALHALIPGQLAARLRMQVHAGREAARHQQQVAGMGLMAPIGVARVQARQSRRLDAQPAAGAQHRGVRLHRQTGTARGLGPVAVGVARTSPIIAIATPAWCRSIAAR
jgi:hypothetical protein